MPRTHTSVPTYPCSANRTVAQKHTQHSYKQNRTSTKRSAAKAKSRLARQKRKALLAGGMVAALIVAVALPNQLSSEAIAQFNCQQVIQSQAEITRSEISALLSIPVGSAKQSVRQAVKDPYCLSVESSKRREHQNLAKHIITEREAYPLAVNSSVWIILNYDLETYVGFDFVFDRYLYKN